MSRAHGIRGRHTRRDKATPDSTHSLPVADNVLARDFTLSGPNQVWSAGITNLWTDEGWRYLASVLDLCDREIRMNPCPWKTRNRGNRIILLN